MRQKLLVKYRKETEDKQRNEIMRKYIEEEFIKQVTNTFEDNDVVFSTEVPAPPQV